MQNIKFKDSKCMQKSNKGNHFTTFYRPKKFSEAIGQVVSISILRSSIVKSTTPHQILLSGGSGLGKTTLARIISSALICDYSQKFGEPCGLCDNCELAFKNDHPDIIEFDAASFGSKEEIKDIASKANFLPVLAKYKIYIIDEAHGLSNAGGQAFLKLLEEPPKHVYFILCTTDPDKMLSTNRGRCVEFILSKPSKADIKLFIENLFKKEDFTYDAEVPDLIYALTDSNFGVRGIVNNCNKIIIGSESHHITKESIELIFPSLDTSLVVDILMDKVNRMKIYHKISDTYDESKAIKSIIKYLEQDPQGISQDTAIELLTIFVKGEIDGYSLLRLLLESWNYLDR